MSQDELSQPHDSLFRRCFSQPETAAAFLKTQLPPSLARDLDWSALRLLPGTHIDPQLRRSESDLLFSVPLADSPTFLYLLFEHQSSFDPNLPIRLLRYIAGIWETHRKHHPRSRLPPILPIVLAQNAKPWKGPRQLEEILQLPTYHNHNQSLRPFLPLFQYQLYQLAEHDYQALPGTPPGKLSLRILKAERIDELLSSAIWDEALFLQALDFLEPILRYLAHATNLDSRELRTKMKTLENPTIQKRAMTLAEELRLEGRQEGRQALIQSILDVLDLRFGTPSSKTKQQIQAIQDLTQLQQIHRHAITSPSLEAFQTNLPNT